MPQKMIKSILSAKVYDVAIESPISHAQILSKRLNNEVFIKREDLQPVYSFKIRGAYNKISTLSDKEKACGVIAASAGNHAQGVALSAAKLGIEAVIVMPKTTPQIKVDSVRNRGGQVVLFGDTFDEACAKAKELQQEKGYTFIHPYDDEAVIAGQGTVGMEIMHQLPDVDAVFIPVGGGGLIAGMASYIKWLRPEVKVIGVESEDSACLKVALENNQRTQLQEVGIFADGVAVGIIGENTFKLCQENVDEVITANTDEICAAVKDLYDDTRSISEPAGALALAGLKKYAERAGISGQKLLCVESGANINFDRLRHISERTEIGEKREAILAVTIPERRGSFLEFCNSLSACSISEFNYRYSNNSDAHLFVGLQMGIGAHDRTDIINNLEDKGFATTDLTEDDVAKIHIRHMVGGRCESLKNERLYAFEFPERPGALLKFLTVIAGKWNISMFHYRNHGAAWGRVLIGLQVEEEDRQSVLKHLESIGYRFCEESNNPAYQLFLK